MYKCVCAATRNKIVQLLLLLLRISAMKRRVFTRREVVIYNSSDIETFCERSFSETGEYNI